MKPGHLRGTPATLAGDNLIVAVAIWILAYDQRLDDALFRNRGGEILKRLRIEIAARLVRVGVQAVDRQRNLAAIGIRRR